MLVKICGATTAQEVRAVAGAGADLIGLWHGVPGGPADLPAERLAALAAEARATGRLRSVLVTFGSDPTALAHTAAGAGTDWIQLHGYQPPPWCAPCEHNCPSGCASSRCCTSTAPPARRRA
ncbi:hypothetical protein [Streptomyces pharetrae]|uniref:hypothetical protein n=1 Tax=Streptomyces pharetrae TaxID=291370 RepID=UPI0026BBA815